MTNKLINLKTIKTLDSGNLSYFESINDIPFEIKRIYFTYDVPINEKRGMHAHKKLKQLLWCPFGNLTVELDDGKSIIKYYLDSPEKALLINNGIWREIIWNKEGSILCVAASDYYDENDYIRDYKEFIDYMKRDI
jgi:dTDP-4-dehydrorhamnose 3,5-epimerase-like enzyme